MRYLKNIASAKRRSEIDHRDVFAMQPQQRVAMCKAYENMLQLREDYELEMGCSLCGAKSTGAVTSETHTHTIISTHTSPGTLRLSAKSILGGLVIRISF